MFVGVVVENFHRCREEQEKEEKMRRLAKRAMQIQKHRKRKKITNAFIKVLAWIIELKVTLNKYISVFKQ